MSEALGTDAALKTALNNVEPSVVTNGVVPRLLILKFRRLKRHETH
jgi:hypothetical protein